MYQVRETQQHEHGNTVIIFQTFNAVLLKRWSSGLLHRVGS